MTLFNRPKAPKYNAADSSGLYEIMAMECEASEEYREAAKYYREAAKFVSNTNGNTSKVFEMHDKARACDELAYLLI